MEHNSKGTLVFRIWKLLISGGIGFAIWYFAIKPGKITNKTANTVTIVFLGIICFYFLIEFILFIVDIKGENIKKKVMRDGKKSIAMINAKRIKRINYQGIYEKYYIEYIFANDRKNTLVSNTMQVSRKQFYSFKDEKDVIPIRKINNAALIDFKAIKNDWINSPEKEYYLEELLRAKKVADSMSKGK